MSSNKAIHLTNKNVGQLIKEIRKESDLTLEEFGKKIGYTKSGLSRIENGHRNLSVKSLQEIFVKLNLIVTIGIHKNTDV